MTTEADYKGKLPEDRSNELTPVFVHLIHGTWPFGPFRRRSPMNYPAWFEEGSDFRDTVAWLSHPAQVSYSYFNWDGSNSYRSRSDASRKLQEHLSASIRSNPDAKHVIIAHSHGGTVAAKALFDGQTFIPEGAISLLICMSTPFAYAMPANAWAKWHLRTSLDCFSLILAGAIAYGFSLHYLGSDRLLAFSLLALLIGVGLERSITIASKRAFPIEDYPKTASEPNVTTVVLRGTRDEASLTISVAQWLNWIMGIPHHFLTKTALKHNRARFVAWAIYSLLVAWPFWIGHLGTAVLLVDVSLFLRSFYAMGFVFVSIATGFFEFRSWLATLIEVDAAPPWGKCTTRVFDFSGYRGPGLRHGIYNLWDVKVVVAEFIRSVVESEHR
jgi:hypothetical protein